MVADADRTFVLLAVLTTGLSLWAQVGSPCLGVRGRGGVLPYLCRRLPGSTDRRAAPSIQFREFPNSRR
jgi:hypothetical protein